MGIKINNTVLKILSYLTRSYGLMLLSFIQVLFVTRQVPVELYGQMQFVNAVIASLSILTLSGAEISIVQSSKSGKFFIFKYFILQRMLWSIIPIVITLIISGFYFLNHDQIYLVLLLSIAIYPLSIFRMVSSHYFGIGNLGKSIIIESNARVFGVIFAILFAYMFPENILLFFLPSLYIESLIYVIWSFPILKNQIPRNEQIQKFCKSELHYVYKRTAMNIFPSISLRLDKLIIGIFFSYSNLAVFSLARTVLDLLKAVAKAIFNVLYQKYAITDEKTLSEKKQKIMMANLIALIIGAISLDVISSILINNFLNQKYSSAIPIIRIFLYSGILTYIANFYQLKWVCTRNIVSEFYNSTIIALVNTILLIIFALVWAYWGVVTATAVKLPLSSTISFIVDKFTKNKKSHQEKKTY